MKIAIIHSDDVGLVARLRNVFLGEGYNIETFEPTRRNLLDIIERISDFDPDVVFLDHEFDGMTGDDIVMTSLSYPQDICIGFSNDPSQKDYCSNVIDPSSNFEDQTIKETILELVNKAASV
jgi:CheY-like chemotaxis protein